MAAPFVLLVVLVALWQLVCSVFAIPEFIFPSPLLIAQALAAIEGVAFGFGRPQNRNLLVGK